MGEAFQELLVSAPEAARRLLGCELERTRADGSVVRVTITETEAYDETDPGSHTFRGVTPRNKVMFGPPGFLYVYFIYGMHYCCNIVTGSVGKGEAVLIRAVEPVIGHDVIRSLRNGITGPAMTNGPAKVCQGLEITRELNGHNLQNPPMTLIMKPRLKESDVETTRRIGLSKGTETLWRFYDKRSDYVSKSSR